MDFTHLHLLITHLPIYGSMLGALVLLYGMLTNSRHTRMAAYLVLLISAIGGVIAFSTGEAAEETVENIQGIGKNMIEEHEESGKLTFAVLAVLGILSLAGLLLTWKNSKYTKGISALVLVVSLASIGMASWTGYLGGQIRHTEIGKAPQQIKDAREGKDND
jgi:uncharacterized membrane protein